MQEEIKIGDVNVPIIKDNNDIYYPISYLMDKVLFKKTGVVGLQKEYSQYIKKYEINYGINNGSIQEVNCISKEGLKEILRHSKIGRLSVEQKRAMNVLLEYLHMDVISEDDRFIKKVSEEVVKSYNEYIRDCINYVLKQEPNIIWQKCSKCENYYPYHENFFRENPHPGKEYPLYTVCKNCNCTETRGKDLIKHPNEEFRIIFNKFGDEVYKLYKQHNTIAIYEHWLTTGNKFMPKIINNEEDKLKIIKYYWDKGIFNKYPEITTKVIHNICKFNVNGNNFIQKIHKELFGIYLKNGVEYIDTIEDAKRIFFDYIKKNNIIIIDIFDYKYYDLITKAHLFGFMKRYNNNLLGFIMELYDNKYGAYKFNFPGIKYWGNKSNRIKALKYLIEEDMKVQIEKVPLYITLTALRNSGSSTMYNVCKKYYKNLFEWINEVYPGRFNERDFDVHYIRNDFDSIDEAEIHDILKERFKNVIYNPRNTDRTINIEGMIPDWFVFTDIRCYIVEYFGLAIDRDIDNSRVNEYQEKTKNKIDKYNKINGYGKVFIFPDDLRDNFSGLKEKLKIII